MSLREDFARNESKLLASGKLQNVEVQSAAMRYVDKGYSPLAKQQEAINAKAEKEQGVSKAIRDNFLQGKVYSK